MNRSVFLVFFSLVFPFSLNNIDTIDEIIVYFFYYVDLQKQISLEKSRNDSIERSLQWNSSKRRFFTREFLEG